MISNAGDMKMRMAWIAAALMLVVGAPAQALTEVDFLLHENASIGFDVPAPSPDWLLPAVAGNFLSGSENPADAPAILYDASLCFMYAGATGCQSDVPLGTGPYTGVTTWSVSEINVPVPVEGLLLYLGGAANGEFEPSATHPNPPDYQPGSIQLVTSGGDFGGSVLPELEEILVDVGGGLQYVYYGIRVFDTDASLTFGYTVDEQLDGGTPIIFANVGRNFIVPEPGTALLVGAGLAALGARRKRS